MLVVVLYMFHLLESSHTGIAVTLGVKRRSRSSPFPFESSESISGWHLQFSIFLRSRLSSWCFSLSSLGFKYCGEFDLPPFSTSGFKVAAAGQAAESCRSPPIHPGDLAPLFARLGAKPPTNYDRFFPVWPGCIVRAPGHSALRASIVSWPHPRRARGQ